MSDWPIRAVAGSAQCGANRSLGAASGAAGQQKICDIGASHEQDESGDPGEQAESVPGFLLKILNASSTWREDDVLLGNLLLVAVVGVGGLSGKPLAKRVGNLGFERFGSNSGLHATESIEPVRFGYLQNSGLALQYGLDVQRNPERGRTVVDTVAEKSRWSDADDGYGMALDVER